MYLLKIIYLFIAFSSLVLSQTKEIKFQKESKLWLEGTSTLHDFEINSKEIKGSLTLESNPQKELKISKLKLIVPVNKLESGKESMNENMYEALNAEDHPNITFDLTSASRISLNNIGDSAKIIALGNLNIAGVTKLINLNVTAVKLANEKYEFKGEKKLLMTDYKVDPPTMFLGTVKTGNSINVKFNLIIDAK